jgi:hypothetical protein
MKDQSCNPGCDTPAPPEDPGVAIVMRGSLADLQRASERLDSSGIDSQLVRGTETDSGGCCKTTIWLVVAAEDAAAAHVVFDEDWRRGLTDEQIAALEAAAAIEHDPDSGEVTCPACLTRFDVGPAECPDCGLAVT